MGVASQHRSHLLPTAALPCGEFPRQPPSPHSHAAVYLGLASEAASVVASLTSSCWDVCVSFQIIQMEKDTRTQRPGYKQGSRDWGPDLYNVHSL